MCAMGIVSDFSSEMKLPGADIHNYAGEGASCQGGFVQEIPGAEAGLCLI